MVSKLLRIEGFAALIAAIALYWYAGFGWMMFALLFLAPDVFMVGYLKNERLGAAVYNIGHTYVAPFLFFAVSTGLNWRVGLAVAFVWAAHIGMDRALGFGLKQSTSFKDTHLGRIGK